MSIFSPIRNFFSRRREPANPFAPEMKRSFAGALQNRLVNDFLADISTADAEIKGSLKTLRGRMRSHERDNNHFRRYLKLAKNNVLGSRGIGLQMKVTERVQTRGKWVEQFDTRANALIEASWKRWGNPKFCTLGRQLSWLDVQALALRSALRDGSTFLRKRYPASNPFRFSLEPFEADYLDTDYAANLPNGHIVRLGVEYDADGAIYAYHLLRHHPGDSFQPRVGGIWREEVPANQVIHLFAPERFGQSEGIPAGVSAVLQLKMLSGYSEAEVIAARVAASKMGFLEPNPQAPGAGYTGAPDGKGGKYMEVEPGSIEQLPYGYQFKPFDPSAPHTNYPDFVKAQLREIAAGLGVSYNSLANDIESVNYSSIRAGLLEEREEWMGLQEWFIQWFVTPIFEDWLQTSLSVGAITDGILTLPAAKFEKFNQPEWKARRWPWVDPLKDTQAHVLRIKNRLTSHRAVIAEGGGDIEDTLSDIEADEQLAESKGLELDVEDPQPEPGALTAPGKETDDD